MASKRMEELISRLNLVPYSDSEEEEELEDEKKVDVVMKESAPPVVSDPKTFRTIEESSDSSSSEDESDELESSSTSTSSSDFDPEDIFKKVDRRAAEKGVHTYRSKKDLKGKRSSDLDLLPPIESLNISVPNEELKPIGQVLSVVDVLVVIQSTGAPVLDMDTVLFIASGTCIGHIFEVFGPVLKPFYSVRFNTEDDIKKLGLIPFTQIYFAPNRRQLTKYVFADKIRDRGTDASWIDDSEPPAGVVYYSDDEEEKQAKLKRKWIPRPRNPVAGQVIPKEMKKADDASGVFTFGAAESVPHPLSNRTKKAINKKGQHESKKSKQTYWTSVAQPNVSDMIASPSSSFPLSNAVSLPSFAQPNVELMSPLPIKDLNFGEPLPPGTFDAPFARPQPFPFHSTTPPPPSISFCANNFSEESGFINFEGGEDHKLSS